MPQGVKLIVALKPPICEVEKNIDFSVSDCKGYRVLLLQFLANGFYIRHAEFPLNFKSSDEVFTRISEHTLAF